MLDNSEAQPRAAQLARTPLVDAVEAFENVGQVFFLHTDAVVGELQRVLLRYKQQDTLTSFTALADFFKQAGLRLPGAGTPDFDGGHKIPLTKRQMRSNSESPPYHGGG